MGLGTVNFIILVVKYYYQINILTIFTDMHLRKLYLFVDFQNNMLFIIMGKGSCRFIYVIVTFINYIVVKICCPLPYVDYIIQLFNVDIIYIYRERERVGLHLGSLCRFFKKKTERELNYGTSRSEARILFHIYILNFKIWNVNSNCSGWSPY